MAQSKNCPFGVNSTIELTSIAATSDSNGIWRSVFLLSSVPVFSDTIVIFFLAQFLYLTANGNFGVVPVLHSVRDITYETNAAALSCKRTQSLLQINNLYKFRYDNC